MSKNNGGPAFPCHDSYRSGMTLRDYFAANASEIDIGSIMADHVVTCDLSGMSSYSITRQQARYMHADAMLAEREK